MNSRQRYDPQDPAASVLYSQKYICHIIFVRPSHLEMATNMRNAFLGGFFSNCYNKTMKDYGIISVFKNIYSLNHRKYNMY